MKGSADKNGEIIHRALKFTSKRSFFLFSFFFSISYICLDHLREKIRPQTDLQRDYDFFQRCCCFNPWSL